MSNVDLTKAFKEEFLKAIEHEDANKHWIGESLPSPSVSEASYSGTETTTGDSPFPARADHTHDTRFRYTICNQLSGKSCPGGSTKTYIDGMGYFAGINMFAPASSQLLVPNMVGTWLINIRLQVNRSSGSFPAPAGVAPAYSVLVEYNNATVLREIEHSNAPQGRASFISSLSEIVRLELTSNLQMSYINHDTVAHNIFFTNFAVTRIAAYESA